MTKSRSPSSRWTSEHGYGQGHRRAGNKILHESAISAWFHVFRIIWSGRYQGKLRPYRCRWTDDYRDGEVAVTHWHVGRGKRK